VYLFLQLFALFLRLRNATDEEARSLPRSYYAQAIISYAGLGLTFVLSYLVSSGNTLVTDAAGVVWQTRSIAEAEATVSIFTMILVAALSAVKLFQGSAFVSNASVDARTEETATMNTGKAA
jgi:hypothetical protein